MRILIVTVATFLLAFASLSYGAVYKCKDSRGATIFSDRPCAADGLRENTAQGATAGDPTKSNSAIPAAPPTQFPTPYDEDIRRLQAQVADGFLGAGVSLEATLRARTAYRGQFYTTKEAQADQRTEQGKIATEDRKARPSVINSAPAGMINTNTGLTNPVTGEFLAPAGPNYVGTRDGRLYVPAGPSGIIDTRTGQFIPVH